MLFALLDYIGVATFAANSALGSREQRGDIVATLLLAVIAGVGGGTLRDLLIGRPVFWIVDPLYLVACGVAVACIWLIGVPEKRAQVFVFLDAVGIGAYAVVGTMKAAAAGVNPLAAIVMGVLTATWGGIMRDVLSARPSVLVRRDIYITATLVASGGYCLLAWLGLPNVLAACLAAAAGAALRSAAAVGDWMMPPPPDWAERRRRREGEPQ